MTEIYKIFCQICNKIYIGKHKVDNREFNNYFGSGKLQKSHLKEHKKENQVKQILLYCEDKDVKYYEEKLIELYNATNSEIGLNVSKKSSGIDKHTEETKEKIKQNHAIVFKENNPMWGKHHSIESKQLMKKRCLIRDNRRKSIVCFSLNNKFMCRYISVRNAEKNTGINRSSIIKCCKGERKTAGKLVWNYV